MIAGWVGAAWGRRGIGGKLLWCGFLPLAFVYRCGAQARNGLFRLGLLRKVRLPRPVISVGNLTVGGTGKTPTCLWLVRELRARGLKAAILTRGYARRQRQPVLLLPDDVTKPGAAPDEASDCGDEPAMMARIYGETVAVDRDRGAAAAALLQRAAVDVFVLDDGYQHRWIERDVDLLLLGADTSGWILPAGPFREPRKNLRRADFLLATAAADEWQGIVPEARHGALYRAALRPVALIGFSAGRIKEFPLTLLSRSKVLAVTGIADPRGVYRLIHEWDGEIVQALEYADHHSYSTRDWQDINRLARSADLIVTTEKDILKLQRFPFAKDKLLALRVSMDVEQGAALVSAIFEKIRPGGQL